MNIPDFETVRSKFPSARQESGGITIECPGCLVEGRLGVRAIIYANGAVGCPRYSSIGREENRSHVTAIREVLSLSSEPKAFISESLFEGTLTLEVSPAGRNKQLLVARNCLATLNRDICEINRADHRTRFVSALKLEDSQRAEVLAALLQIADRFAKVERAIDEDDGDECQIVDFKALEDGRILETIGSGLAVYDPATKEARIVNKIEIDGITYKPLGDKFILGGGLGLATSLVEYVDDLRLEERIAAYLFRNVDIPERERRLSAKYIQLSYLFDKLLEIPYLRPTGPRGNGKSRFILTVGGVCYRSLIVINPSAASLFRTVDRYHPTLCIDEANFGEDSEDTSAMMQILNSGYQQMGKISRVEPGADGEFEIRLFDPYCPKIIGSLKTFDSQAFESRCLQVELVVTSRMDIPFRLSKRMLAEQDELRGMLTLWRLRNWNRDLESVMDAAEEELKRHHVEPRYIQVSTPLYALVDDPQLRAGFLAMIQRRDTADADARRDSLEGALVGAIHSLLFEESRDSQDQYALDWRRRVPLDDSSGETAEIPLPEDGKACESILVEQITAIVNKDLPDRQHHDAKWIGRQVRRLGLTTREVKRRASSVYRKTALVFERNTLERLFRQYDLPISPIFDPPNPPSPINTNQVNSLPWADQIQTEAVIENDPPSLTRSKESRLPDWADWADQNSGNTVDGIAQGLSQPDPLVGAPSLVALDTETTGLGPDSKMIGLSISYDGQAADYVTDSQAWPLMLPEPEQTVIFHNAKFDLSVLERSGLPTPERWEDTFIAAHLIDENWSHGLKSLAERYLGIEKPLSFKEVDRMRLLDPEVFEDYAKNDARYTFQLWKKLEPALQQQNLMRVYELEKSVVPVVRNMEMAGMQLDLARMSDMCAVVDEEIERVRTEIFEHTGAKFDLNSPLKTAVILYDKLGVPSRKETRTGQRSVDKAALENVRGYHPTVDALLRYREIDKLAGTFLKVLPTFADDAGRIHPEFHQLKPKTGRFSCSNPNVQQIPSRSELGKKLRTLFTAATGHRLCVADYGQMELRILAHYSKDKLLLSAYKSADGADLHTLTASRMFGKVEAEVSKQERAIAKMINFGIAYGITSTGLFNRLRPQGIEVTEDQCERFISDYFRAYAGVRTFLDQVARTIREREYVRSIFGRRRRLAGIDGREIRQAQNFVIQGTSADLVKDAMVRLSRVLPTGARLIAMVHDELIVECPKDMADDVRALMIEVMQQAPEGFSIPLTVDAKIAENWGDAK